MQVSLVRFILLIYFALFLPVALRLKVEAYNQTITTLIPGSGIQP